MKKILNGIDLSPTVKGWDESPMTVGDRRFIQMT